MPVSATTQCTCGAAIDPSNRFCGSCGQQIPTHVQCGGCDAAIDPGQSFCGNCGAAARTASEPTRRPESQEIDSYAFSGLTGYYKDEFTRIRESHESYKGKWNWAAFFFGAIWALTKGLWLPALICIVSAIFTGGLGAVVYWFVFAARGNYMYYCKQVKQKDLPI